MSYAIRVENLSKSYRISHQSGGRPTYRTLREDGLIKAWRGDTSLDEVLRVTGLSE